MTYNSYKANLGSVVKPVNIFVEEETRQFFEEVLHIHPTCYSMLHNMYTVYLMFSVCIYSMEVVHKKQHFFRRIKQLITNNEECKEILVMCEECKQKFISCRCYIESHWLLG